MHFGLLLSSLAFVSPSASSSPSSLPIFPSSLEQLYREAAGATCDLFQDRSVQGHSRCIVDISQLPELSRPNLVAASAEEDESPLLIDFLVGYVDVLRERGFKRCRCFWSKLPLSLSARERLLKYAENPLRIRVDALGVGDIADDDEIIILVRPNSVVPQRVLEHIQSLCIQALHRKIPVVIINPEILSYPAVGGIRHRPMLLGDFEMAYYVDPDVYMQQQKICGILRRYPRPWEMYCNNLSRPDVGYLYFSQSESKPSIRAVAEELIRNGLHIWT